MQKMKTLALRVMGTAAILSAFGFTARWMQNISIFEEGTGLARTGAFASILVILLILGTLAAVAVLLIPTLGQSLSEKPAGDIRSDSMVYKVICMISGAVICIAGAATVLSANKDAFPTLQRVLGILAIASGGGIICTAQEGKNGADSLLASFFTLVPVLFGCFWIIVSYKHHSANPVVWQYSIEILAICAATIALYLIAGFVFCRPRLFSTCLASCMAAFLCFMCLGDTRALQEQALFAGFGLYFITTVYFLIEGLDPNRKVFKHLKED